jgi:chemotaxis protein CheD
MSVAAQALANLPRPIATGAQGEARTFYFERDFERHAVKIMPGEFFVAKEDVVICTVLGSCVSACLWDKTSQIGGMNHFMLPGGEGSGVVNASGRFGAFAMEQLINELIKRGARKASLEAKVFGGGAVLKQLTSLNVGERNASFVLDFLKTEGIRVVSQDLLDVHPRRLLFFPTTGRALCKKLTTADRTLVMAEQQAEQKYKAKINTAPVSGDIELF